MKNSSHLTIVHLGSNLGNRELHLLHARQLLESRVGTIIRTSAIYRSEPWGLSQQPDFLNQALLLSTSLSPNDLLQTILELEREMGRERGEKWGPRLIDVDIISYDDVIIHEPQLQIPHPQMHRRNFVLIPLAEIAPDWRHPENGKTAQELLAESGDALKVEPYRAESNPEIRQSGSLPWSFMVIEGNIGAGKTTLCQMMARDFGCKLILEQFAENPFLPFFYQNPERYAFPVELFFMTERHKQLQEELQQKSLFQTSVVADYFFLKTLLFAKNNLGEEEYRLFQRLFSVLNAAFPKPDLLVFLHRPVDALLSNIRKRGRGYEQDISAAYLAQIQQVYFDFFKSEPPFPIIVLDLAEADFQHNPAHYDEILKVMFQEKITGVYRHTIAAK